ncbi:MAG: RNA polymerase sigma factor [Clostridia bacterium]|nr:RNA polymerase sigma factor [Clostridia bacterium]
MDVFLNQQCDNALRRLASGDMSALEDIYSKLGRRIYMLALSVLRDTHSAEDIMQDTFVRLAAEAHAYRHGSNAIAFILTVTRNLSINLLNRRRRECPTEYVPDVSDDTDAPCLTALEALSLLDETERQIVVLKLDGGMRHKQIAELIGISTAACQKRYRRALEKLKPYYLN